MKKNRPDIHTRGNAAETPNWRFGLKTSVPRREVPEFCQGLDFIARERNGGSYYYPDYNKGRMATAFEWYLPFKGAKFGYKIGVEFWINECDLKELGAYVLYGEDHPLRGSSPAFSTKQQRHFQGKLIETISAALNWRTERPLREFFTVHYLRLGPSGVVKSATELPSLDAVVLPSVLIGKENERVSAVIQRVPARFRGEAEQLGARRFLQLCALLTLSSGSYYEGYQSTLGRTALKGFVDRLTPVPPLQSVYPKGKYRTLGDTENQVSLDPLSVASKHYASLDTTTRSKFDNCLFAYYSASALARKKFRTIAVVALIAALRPYRSTHKCDGSVTCSKCGALGLRHDLVGEATSMATSLSDAFGLNSDDVRRAEISQMVKAAYRGQRSAYVHEAIHRHSEFHGSQPEVVPGEESIISDQLDAHNQLLTLELLTQRALLQHLAELAHDRFDPVIYGIDPEKYKLKLGSAGHFVVGSKRWVAIRSMGRFGP